MKRERRRGEKKRRNVENENKEGIFETSVELYLSFLPPIEPDESKNQQGVCTQQLPLFVVYVVTLFYTRSRGKFLQTIARRETRRV